MAGELATAFVRIRPNFAGFKGEAEAGTARAGAALGKVFALAFGTVVAAELAKHSVEAAATQAAAIARVTQIAKSAGASLQLDGKSLRDNLVELAEKTGFSVEDLAQAFGRLEQQTKDTGKTFEYLGTVADVARARGQGVAQVATAITRAYAGNAQGLGRLGIILPKYTAQQDALKKTHDDLLASGGKLTAQQALQYKQALKDAAVSDKLTGSQKALAEVQARFKGQGSIFGETAAGQVARFHVAIEELEVSVGDHLIPYLGAAAEAGRKWADELSHSASFAEFASNAVDTLVSGAQGLGQVFSAVAPVIQATAEALQLFVGTVGAGPLLAAYAGYKAIGIALGVNARLTAALTAAKAAETSAEAANTAVVTANAEAQNLAATSTLRYTGAAAANTVTVEAQTAAIAEQRVATGVLGTALTALGPQLAILGGAAIIGGLFYLSTLTDAQTQKVNELRDAYKGLKEAQQGIVDATRTQQGAALAVSSARVGRNQASETLRQARSTQARDLADEHKSAAVREQDALAVAQAEDGWRQANARLLESERTLREDAKKTATSIDVKREATKKLTDTQIAQLAFQSRAGIGARGANLSKNVDAEAASWRKLAADTSITTKAQRFNLNQLADIADATHKLPSLKQITIALNDHEFYDRLNAVAQRLGAFGQLAKNIVTGAANAAPRGGAAATITPPAAVKHYTATIASATASGVSQGLSQADIARQVAASFKAAVITAKQSLASIGDELGSQIGQVMDAALAASEAKLDSSPAAARVKQLTAEIAALEAQRSARDSQQTIDTTAKDLADLQAAFGPGAHTANQDAQIQAARVAALDAQDAAKEATLQGQADTAQKSLDDRKAELEKRNDVEKQYAARRVADLDSELNRGLITEHQYVVQLNALLRREGANYKSAGKLLGTAFATGFSEQLQAALAQAKAIANLTPGQRGTGSGNAPTVTDPRKVSAKTAADLNAQRAEQAASKTADNTAETVAEIKKLGGIVSKAGSHITVNVPPNLSDKDDAKIAKLVKLLK